MTVEVVCQGFTLQMNVHPLEQILWAYIELYGRTHYKEQQQSISLLAGGCEFNSCAGQYISI